jgi:hypothetical protein
MNRYGRKENRKQVEFTGDILLTFQWARSMLSRTAQVTGTAVAQWLQIRRSLVRFQLVSLDFSIDIKLLIALWPWGRLSL